MIIGHDCDDQLIIIEQSQQRNGNLHVPCIWLRFVIENSIICYKSHKNHMVTDQTMSFIRSKQCDLSYTTKWFSWLCELINISLPSHFISKLLILWLLAYNLMLIIRIFSLFTFNALIFSSLLIRSCIARLHIISLKHCFRCDCDVVMHVEMEI